MLTQYEINTLRATIPSPYPISYRRGNDAVIEEAFPPSMYWAKGMAPWLVANLKKETRQELARTLHSDVNFERWLTKQCQTWPFAAKVWKKKMISEEIPKYSPGNTTRAAALSNHSKSDQSCAQGYKTFKQETTLVTKFKKKRNEKPPN